MPQNPASDKGRMNAIISDGQQTLIDMDATAKYIEPGCSVIRVKLPATVITSVLYLPPVASCPGEEFFIQAYGTLAGGAALHVADQDDGLVDYTSDALTAALDHVWVRNVAGKRYVQLAELTT